MKFRLPLLVSSTVFVLLVFSCEVAAPVTESDLLGNGIIRPKAGPGILMSKQVLVEEDKALSLSAENLGKLKIAEDYIIHGNLEENLDADPSTEQVLTVKKRNDPADLIYILLVDFQEDKQSWETVWTGTTASTNLKTFSLGVQDLTGTHEPSIVAIGATREGLQTLSAFRLKVESGKLGGETILQTSADTEIMIETSTRDAAYEEAGALGKAFPILVTEKNPAPAGVENNDLVKTTYTWNPGLGRYTVSNSVIIPGLVKQEETLFALFKTDVKELESYIQGAWIRTDTPGKQLQLVYFDAIRRELHLIEGDHLEGHDWLVSHKPPAGNRLVLYLQNNALSSVKATLSITLTQVDEMTLYLQDRPEWTGNFKRLPPHATDLYKNHSNYQVPLHPLVLSGLFKGERDSEIVFSGQGFTSRKAGLERTGAWVSFNLDKPIITFAYLDHQGMIEETENFRALIHETINGKKVLRTLELIPVKLLVNGAQDSASESLRYSQIEDLN